MVVSSYEGFLFGISLLMMSFLLVMPLAAKFAVVYFIFFLSEIQLTIVQMSCRHFRILILSLLIIIIAS
jgi:hypothetical protein